MRNFGNLCRIFSVPYQIPYAAYAPYATYARNTVKLRTPLTNGPSIHGWNLLIKYPDKQIYETVSTYPSFALSLQ